MKNIWKITLGVVLLCLAIVGVVITVIVRILNYKLK